MAIPIIPTIQNLRDEFLIPKAVLIINDIARRPYNIPPAGSTQQQSDKFPVTFADTSDSPLSYTSSLGTPVYTNIEFLPGQYETNTKGVFKSFGSTTDGPNRLRYEAVLVTVNQEKKIVTTDIQGRDGTIKEYIGLGDYEVTVNGIISGNNGQRPMDQIISLKKMLDAPIAIQVASTYLQALSINWMVLKSYTLEEKEGGYSYQGFTLNFISDVLQELQLTNI